jgi:outer membrane protein assembly factor BamB
MRRLLMSLGLLVALSFALLADDWPQWRGPNRDGVSKETDLLQTWPAEGPKLRWKATNIGTGYSAPIVVKGRVYLQTTKENDEFTLALDEANGKEVWSTKIGAVGKNRGPDYPGTRATPTADGDRLYCLASDGTICCLDTAGSLKWKKDLIKDFGGVVGGRGSWAYSESVLVDGDAVVCTPGGKDATLLALNKLTGDVIWKCSVPDAPPADYASIVSLEGGGTKQYVQFLNNKVVGVDARTGKFLWQYDKTISPFGACILTPLVHGNKVFTSAGGKGGSTIELSAENGKVEVKEIYFDKTLGAGIGGVVLVDGHVYGASPTLLFCVEFATGKVKWTDPAPKATALCLAGGRIYARGQQGDVFLIEPSPKEYREKGKFKQPDRGPRPAWPHPVVANGGFYLRDWTTLLCYDVKAK